MMRRIVIRSGEVFFEGHDLLKLHASGDFLSVFGQPSRRRDIRMHPGGMRVAMVWDDKGLVAYEDLPGHWMSHLHFAFDPKETPEQPAYGIMAVIEINGGLVAGNATEHDLPRLGSTPVTADFGWHFFHRSESYSLSFQFERRRDARGRKAGARRLAFLSFSWLKET